ncbi:DUF6090 family protein [uncultured Psychroserpens sp.]|uniref:DUF6090 family protein n=1 Tax=uncultured Psychroserpens sp. TaxID=255436 RepID=UPI00260A6F6C|nr:DUF6090 family protein [uncultured Psychroserpens sp.]
MKKLIKGINWKYAFGELLLIFLGITIAIWFNNWNETKKSNKIELKSIKEIKSAIHQDILDINENIYGFSMRVKLYNQVIEHVEKDLPMNDSLNTKLPYLLGVTTFLSNEGPYETLKSRGLETISNDSLRLQIALYYDFEYEKIKTNEKQHYEHYINYLKPLMIKHFDLSNYALKPIDYDTLFDDFKFKQTINWALRTDQYMLELYKNLLKNGETLIKELDDEIALID